MANFLSNTFGRLTGFLTGGTPGFKLPPLLGLPKVFSIRKKMRSDNLYDTGKIDPIEVPPLGKPGERERASRTVDGTYNDLEQPRMGSAGARFGRNVPLDRTTVDSAALLTPSPRTVSLELMTRDQFKPAESLNLLAAAWIQFEVHDWMSHDTNEAKPISVPLEDEDDWPDRPMEIPSTVPYPRPVGDGMPPVYATQD